MASIIALRQQNSFIIVMPGKVITVSAKRFYSKGILLIIGTLVPRLLQNLSLVSYSLTLSIGYLVSHFSRSYLSSVALNRYLRLIIMLPRLQYPGYFVTVPLQRWFYFARSARSQRSQWSLSMDQDYLTIRVYGRLGLIYHVIREAAHIRSFQGSQLDIIAQISPNRRGRQYLIKVLILVYYSIIFQRALVTSLIYRLLAPSSR